MHENNGILKDMQRNNIFVIRWSREALKNFSTICRKFNHSYLPSLFNSLFYLLIAESSAGNMNILSDHIYSIPYIYLRISASSS